MFLKSCLYRVYDAQIHWILVKTPLVCAVPGLCMATYSTFVAADVECGAEYK